MPRYKTTRPVVPLTADRKLIEATVNDHLKIQLRRFEVTDLPHIYRLRTQEKVMINTAKGRIDEDIEASRAWMNRKLPPNDTVDFSLAIWAQEKDEPWEYIGSMACHSLVPVPTLGYMIREEWWGKSIVSTAVRAYLQVHWALPRVEVELNTDSFQDEHDLHLANLELNQDGLGNDSDGCKIVPEILLAEVEENNVASQKIVERLGFVRQASESKEENGRTVVCHDYILSKPFLKADKSK